MRGVWRVVGSLTRVHHPQIVSFRMHDADPGNDELLGTFELPVLPFVLCRGHLIEDWFPLVNKRGAYKGKIQAAVMVRSQQASRCTIVLTLCCCVAMGVVLCSVPCRWTQG